MSKEDQESVLAVDSVDDIRALPRETDAVLVNRLDDAKAQALSRLRQLRVLYQDGSPFGLTDVGMEALGGLATVEKLDLEWAEGITDRGLVALRQLRRLRWLDLSFCPGVSDAAVLQLRRALPDVEIER